jgi:DNA primase
VYLSVADNFAQTVKSQVDIVKIIGEYVKLRKSGAQNYSGLCPFHKEKTGSFSVNATHGYFYCFGCHEKGDVFTFVMKMDVISFPEAVRAVATKAGIPLPKREFSSPEEAREAGIRKQLIDLHEGATQYFEAQLKSATAARAREYLTGRGVTAETIAKFRMGFAPDDFNDMRDRLKAHFTDEAMRASGLFSSSEKNDDGAPTGQLYARFRKRIMFPIANEAGKTIAFTARALESVDDKGRPIAKYINSPETPLYTKGNILFNLDKAKADMRAHDFALLVEGQMDCISVYMAGVKNVLATSGTAFTEMQVRLLSRFTKRVVVNFDPDQAGAAAAEKSISLLTEEGFEVKVIALEGGLDPDRFVREQGIQAYMAALRTAKRHSDYLIDRARQLFPARTAEAKMKAMNFLLPHIRRMPNAIQRAEFVEDAAQKLAIDSAIIRQEIKQAATHKLESVQTHRHDPASEAERVLLRALVLPETDPARARASIELQQHPEWIEGLPAGPLLEALANGPVPQNPLDAAPDDGSRAMLAQVLASQIDTETASQQQSRTQPQSMDEQVQHVLHSLELLQLGRRQRELRTATAEAERRGDQAMVDRLNIEKMKVDKQLRDQS